MTSMRGAGPTGNRLAVMLLAAVFLAGSTAPAAFAFGADLPSVSSVRRAAFRSPAAAVPARLTDPNLDLRAGPVALPLILEFPTFDVIAPVSGVGLTSADAMDAPEGALGDPVWQQAFWYRGSAVPGAASTALIAGHIDGPRGSPAVFGWLAFLRQGDPVVVHDMRTGLAVHFTVISSNAYTLDEAATPSVLSRIYGAGPVAGTAPRPSADGLSHLTLITCAGRFRDGTHDHRLVVDAIRTG